MTQTIPRCLISSKQLKNVINTLNYNHNYIYTSKILILFTSNLPGNVLIRVFRNHHIHDMNTFNHETYKFIELYDDRAFVFNKILNIIQERVSEKEDRIKIRDTLSNIEPVIQWCLQTFEITKQYPSFKDYIHQDPSWEHVQKTLGIDLDDSDGLIPICEGMVWRFREEFKRFFYYEDSWTKPEQIVDDNRLERFSDIQYNLIK